MDDDLEADQEVEEDLRGPIDRCSSSEQVSLCTRISEDSTPLREKKTAYSMLNQLVLASFTQIDGLKREG